MSLLFSDVVTKNMLHLKAKTTLRVLHDANPAAASIKDFTWMKL